MKNRGAGLGFWCVLLLIILGMMGAGLADVGKTPEEWKNLAEQGQAGAQYEYASILRQGRGVDRDEVAAAAYLRKAAEQGHARAQADLAMRYNTGEGVARDVVEAVQWLTKAAEGGDLDAQTTLAIWYLGGEGVPKNEVVALKWLEQLHKKGRESAGLSLSKLIADGRPKTDAEAAATYKREAYEGSAVAQTAYGACLEEGRGTTKNLTEAARWYILAAKQGNLVGKYRAGLLLREVPERRAEAYEWLAVAGLEGIDAGSRAAEALKSEILPKELEAAESRVAAVRARLNQEQLKWPLPNAGKAGGAMPQGAWALLELPREPVASGTGFFVTTTGYLVTNYHVVKNGKRFEVQKEKQRWAAKLLRVDAENDLAVLKVDGAFQALEVIPCGGVGLGAPVLTIGFPRPMLQGLSPKLSRGEIGSVNGAHDDPNSFQVSLPLQPGNSGGALVNEHGKVIGVVRAVMDSRAALFTDGTLPQAVNYAVKSDPLLKLMQALPDLLKNLPVSVALAGSVVEKAEAASVLIWVYEE